MPVLRWRLTADVTTDSPSSNPLVRALIGLERGSGQREQAIQVLRYGSTNVSSTGFIALSCELLKVSLSLPSVATP